MPDLATNLLLSVAVFAGAFSSLAGFAFSAVAGAILLRIFQPMEAWPAASVCRPPICGRSAAIFSGKAACS